MKTNVRTLLFSMLNVVTFVALFAFAASATAQVYDETYYSPTKNGQKNTSNYTGVQQQSVAVDDSAKEENVTVILKGEEPEQRTVGIAHHRIDGINERRVVDIAEQQDEKHKKQAHDHVRTLTEALIGRTLTDIHTIAGGH